MDVPTALEPAPFREATLEPHALVRRLVPLTPAVPSPAPHEPAPHEPAPLVVDAAPAPSGAKLATWFHRYTRLAIGLDAVIGAVAASVPAAFSTTLASPRTQIPLALVGAVVWPLAVAAMRGYQRRTADVGVDGFRAVLRAWVTVIVAGALAAGLLPGLDAYQREALLKLAVVGAPLAVGLSIATRLTARHVLRRAQRSGRLVRRVVMVGTATAVAELGERLDVEDNLGMQLVGLCVPDADRRVATRLGLPVLGNLEQVPAVITEHGCDTVAVTSDGATRSTYLRELSWALEGSGTEMLVDPGLVEVAGPRMHIRPLVGFPLLHIEAPQFKGPRRVVKRTADIVLSTLGGLAILPLLLAIAMVIKLQDGGPVLFRQERVGRGGAPFWMYKFRSMRVGAEHELSSLLELNEGSGGLFKLGSDPRVTRLGAVLRSFSLDELPQLLNVLNGTMSLVGPRPHLSHELEQMPPHSSRRSLVTPGMTGLWQVSGRSGLEGSRAIQLDLRYVENWSLTLDLVILVKTVAAVLRRSGAS